MRRGFFLLAFVLAFAAAAAADKTPPAKPLDVNTATAAEFQQLPGVGPSMAAAIVRHRERNGAFRRLEDMLIIRGMSRKKLNRLRPYLVLMPVKRK